MTFRNACAETQPVVAGQVESQMDFSLFRESRAQEEVQVRSAFDHGILDECLCMLKQVEIVGSACFVSCH